MVLGIFYGLLACVLWGLTYLLPILLPEYSTLQISLARAFVMGLTAIFSIWGLKSYLSQVSKTDWIFATKLTLVGNLIQPWFLFTSVQYAGVPLGATFFGLVPVCVALIANERDRRKGRPYLTLRKLFFPIFIIFCGLIMANLEGLMAEFKVGKESGDFLIGCVFAISSTAMWTWYPIRNADWLLEHPKISPVFFTSMQSILLLPFGFILFVCNWFFFGSNTPILGNNPVDFVCFLIFAGVFCSFGATALWNAMSQKVPTAVVGPMLVFETIFSVIFGLIYDGSFPSTSLFVGMVLLVGGVVYTLKLFNDLLEKKTFVEEICE